MEVVGQLTPAKKFPLLTITELQLAPPFVVLIAWPKSPTATHVVVAAQLMPLSWVVIPVACMAQVDPPFVVALIRPSDEPAKHVLMLGQLIACSELPSGSGFCQPQVPRVIGARGPSGLSRGFD
jgi:hypothetical protein